MDLKARHRRELALLISQLQQRAQTALERANAEHRVALSDQRTSYRRKMAVVRQQSQTQLQAAHETIDMLQQTLTTERDNATESVKKLQAQVAALVATQKKLTARTLPPSEEPALAEVEEENDQQVHDDGVSGVDDDEDDEDEMETSNNLASESAALPRDHATAAASLLLMARTDNESKWGPSTQVGDNATDE
jgi:hypothetical protein